MKAIKVYIDERESRKMWRIMAGLNGLYNTVIVETGRAGFLVAADSVKAMAHAREVIRRELDYVRVEEIK